MFTVTPQKSDSALHSFVQFSLSHYYVPFSFQRRLHIIETWQTILKMNVPSGAELGAFTQDAFFAFSAKLLMNIRVRQKHFK